MIKFKKGDKVLCIKPPEGALVAGKVYTVSFQDDDDYLHLDEMSRGGWSPSRFQLSNPVVTRNGEHKRMFRLEK